MHSHTTIRSWPAIGLGGFFALVTAAALLQDVVAGATPTTSHALALAALVAAIAAGHMAWPAFRSGAIVNGALLVVLAIAATTYVVVSSAARNAASQQAASIGAREARDAHRSAKAHLARIEAELTGLGSARTPQAVRADMDAANVPRSVFLRTKECTDVTRPDSFAACRPILALRQEMAQAIRRQDLEHQRTAATAALEKLGAPPPDTGWSHTARVLAAIPGVDASAADIESRLVLLMPLLVVLIAELGTIAFLRVGLAHVRRAPRDRIGQSDYPALAQRDAVALVRTFSPDRPDRGGRRGGGPHIPNRPEQPDGSPDGRKDEVLAALLTDLGLGRTIGSQRKLCDRFDVPRSTMSDWLGQWESDGLIPARRTVGRCKTLAAD